MNMAAEDDGLRLGNDAVKNVEVMVVAGSQQLGPAVCASKGLVKQKIECLTARETICSKMILDARFGLVLFLAMG